MISCQKFFEILEKQGITFFTGIPDSTFKDWMSFLADNDNLNLQNLVACNECEAIALAVGYHLATNKIGAVYMQNSGLGKCINPLTSICDPEVYAIPVLLLIGWRGEPGKIDAPQHKKMGQITIQLLETLKIPYSILEPDLSKIKNDLEEARLYFTKNKGPYAFIIKKNLFQRYELKDRTLSKFELTRDTAIKLIMENLSNDELIISSTGYLSRELFEYTESRKKDHHKNFYNIGGMGCACSIGLSIALQKPNKKVIIFDGDGAILMQMGAFATLGKYSPSNLIHIIFDNSVHESTGCQPTNSMSVNFRQIALACRYRSAILVKTEKKLIKTIRTLKKMEGPILLIIKIGLSLKSDLKRPNKQPTEYKEAFMNNLL